MLLNGSTCDDVSPFTAPDEVPMRLLLIRHGVTADNIARTIGSRLPGPPLSADGIAQASALARRLAGEQVSRIHSSRAVRAVQTAASVAEALRVPLHEVDGAQEIDAGDLEGLPHDEAMPAYFGTIQRWWTDRSARIPGGESGHEFMARFDGAIATICTRDEADGTVALVSHEAAIRVWASSTASNLDAESSRRLDLRNTGIVTLEGSVKDGWRATDWSGLALPQ